MTELHKERIKRHYEMLYGIWSCNKHVDDFLCKDSKYGKSNENTIADHIIAPITRSGPFNKNWYSFWAIDNLFKAKDTKYKTSKDNHIDHIMKTKQIARLAWNSMGKDIIDLSSFAEFLEKNVKLCVITKQQNHDMGSKNKHCPLDRYQHLGIDYIYIKKDNVRWKNIVVISDLLKHFEKVSVEELLK